MQVPIKWPRSRDEVWKANIPHTHLATEKSDQNWMVVRGEKIAFPGGGTHFHYGADKYIRAMANVSIYISVLSTYSHPLIFLYVPCIICNEIPQLHKSTRSYFSL